MLFQDLQNMKTSKQQYFNISIYHNIKHVTGQCLKLSSSRLGLRRSSSQEIVKLSAWSLPSLSWLIESNPKTK